MNRRTLLEYAAMATLLGLGLDLPPGQARGRLAPLGKTRRLATRATVRLWGVDGARGVPRW